MENSTLNFGICAISSSPNFEILVIIATVVICVAILILSSVVVKKIALRVGSIRHWTVEKVHILLRIIDAEYLGVIGYLLGYMLYLSFASSIEDEFWLNLLQYTPAIVGGILGFALRPTKFLLSKPPVLLCAISTMIYGTVTVAAACLVEVMTALLLIFYFFCIITTCVWSYIFLFKTK